MVFLKKKLINGKPYWYIVKTARVDGKVKTVSQVYLGNAEKILEMKRQCESLTHEIRREMMPVTENSKVIDTILNRRSVREFTDSPVSAEDINIILNAGRWAPSGLNNQPWRFIVIREKETIMQVSECTHYTKVVAGAPLLIAVYLDGENSYNYTKDVQAVGAAIQNMLLAVCELGLGAVWLGEILKQGEKVNSILECPESFELMAVLAIGEPVRKERTSPRKELNELVFEEKYGKVWEG